MGVNFWQYAQLYKIKSNISVNLTDIQLFISFIRRQSFDFCFFSHFFDLFRHKLPEKTQGCEKSFQICGCPIGQALL